MPYLLRTKSEGVSAEKNDKKKLLVAIQDIPGARLMMIEVEKVLEGGAIVIIDDKWHARLETTGEGVAPADS